MVGLNVKYTSTLPNVTDDSDYLEKHSIVLIVYANYNHNLEV